MRQGADRNSVSSEVPKGRIPKEAADRRSARVKETVAPATNKGGAVKQVRLLVRYLHNSITIEGIMHVTERDPDQEKSITLGLINQIFGTVAPTSYEVGNSETMGTVEKIPRDKYY